MSEAEAPREGIEGSLPKCMKVAVFEGRRALWVSRDGCGKTHDYHFVHAITAGPICNWEPHTDHPCVIPWCRRKDLAVDLEPRDSPEAEAAWEKAERWVRTGELE